MGNPFETCSEIELEDSKKKTKNYCEWNPQGNGHYETTCGKLFYDKGRFNRMLSKVYKDNFKPIPTIKMCPNCGKETE